MYFVSRPTPKPGCHCSRLLLTVILTAAAGISFGRPAAAADEASAGAGNPQVTLGPVVVGFGRIYKVGEWAPLWATVESADDRTVSVIVDAPDPDDNLAAFTSPPVQLKARTATRIEARFRTGKLAGDLQVRVVDAEGRMLASRRLRAGGDPSSELEPAQRLDRPLRVVLGKVELIEPQSADAGGRGQSVARLASFDELPTDWRAWESIGMLVLPTGKSAGGGTSLLSQISAERDAVLQKWVRMGGHLLISVGNETAEFQASPLARWIAPLIVERQMNERLFSTLEAYAGQAAPLKVSAPLKAAQLAALPSANVLVRHTSSAHALAASVPCGFGRVTLVSIDLDAPPLSNWKALPAVLQKLSGAAAVAPGSSTSKVNRQLTHVGVTDLATQLQQTQEDFSAVHRPSYWWVMGLILLYVAVIGPADYFLVHRLLRRPELTWFTFPVLVCAGVALAAWEARRSNDQGLLGNQFDLVDIDTASGLRRAQSWFSLYSPEHRRFSVAVKPADQAAAKRDSASASEHPVTTWLGPPENAVGGIYRSGAGSFASRSYRITESGVAGLPVPQWSTRTLTTAWDDTLASAVDCRLETFGAGQLKGTIAHHFDFPLEDCLLAVGGWAYMPTTENATLAPHVEWRPSGNTVRQRDLRALLTGERRTRRNKNDDFSSDILATTEVYNPVGRDRSQIVRMLTFHEAAGGTEYTGLANAALRRLELTEIMQLGRGILIGRLPQASAHISIDGAEVHPSGTATWVRIVLPVVQSERAPEKTIPKASERPDHSVPSSGNPP